MVPKSGTSHKMKLSNHITNPRNATVIACVVINLLIIVWIFISQAHLPPEVPLFYGLPSGEEQLSQSPLLILPPIISLILIGLNFLLIRTTKDKFLQNVLLSTMVVITALSTITIAKIIFLVG